MSVSPFSWETNLVFVGLRPPSPRRRTSFERTSSRRVTLSSGSEGSKTVKAVTAWARSPLNLFMSDTSCQAEPGGTSVQIQDLRGRNYGKNTEGGRITTGKRALTVYFRSSP